MITPNQMQLTVPQRRYPINSNHTPRTFRRGPSENILPTPSRHTAVAFQQKQTRASPEAGEVEQAMVAATPQSPGQVRQAPPNVLRKSLSVSLKRSASIISRRHSWTSTTNRGPFIASDMASPIPESPDQLLFDDSEKVRPSNASKTTFLTTRPGATFDMAYFLRHTGPPPPARETSREDMRKLPGRKRNRGLFGKKKDVLDAAILVVDEEPKSAVFIPPEGVEQKTTVGGSKYLQIVPHPNLLDFRDITLSKIPSRSRGFSNPQPENSKYAIGTDALDTWISTFSLQNKDTDLSVKLQTTPKMQTTSMLSSVSGPRTPQSFVSEARSWMPSDPGFGLSILDGPTMEPYCQGASNGSEALCSNPPSDPTTPLEQTYTQLGGIELVELPLLERPASFEKRVDSARAENVSSEFSQCRQEKVEERSTEKFDRRSTDVLAGQGLRRPFREHDNMDHVLPGIQDLVPSAVLQGRRNREAAVRARKIKALQEARRNIDDIVKERLVQKGASPAVHELVDAFEEQTPAPSIDNSPSKQSNVHLSQVMLVAEQIPIPRGRQVKKPARLVLRDKSISRHSLAFRSGDAPSGSTSLDSSPSSSTTNHRHPYKQSTITPPLPALPSKSSARNTPTTSFFTPYSTAKHFSTPLLSTTLTPQAVTATATLIGGHRTSVCSSHTSSNREARLEARVEALERENRLLEAALMAVLKTSGTLNHCPCVVLKERSDVHSANMNAAPAPLRPSPLTPSGSRSGTPCPPVKQGSELKRVTEEGADVVGTLALSSSASSTHTRRGSMDSNGSGISALEVYLRTKIGV